MILFPGKVLDPETLAQPKASTDIYTPDLNCPAGGGVSAEQWSHQGI